MKPANPAIFFFFSVGEDNCVLKKKMIDFKGVFYLKGLAHLKGIVESSDGFLLTLYSHIWVGIHISVVGTVRVAFRWPGREHPKLGQHSFITLRRRSLPHTYHDRFTCVDFINKHFIFCALYQ